MMSHSICSLTMCLHLYLILIVVTTPAAARNLHPCHFNHSTNFLNCSHRGLRSVPSEAFQVDTEGMDLSFNKITDISNETFKTGSRLQYLDISHNGLIRFDAAAFEYLDQLLYLNLSHNFLKAESTDIFQPLASLTLLRFGQFKPIRIDRLLGKLKNLSELYLELDVIRLTFGKGFRALSKLRSIIAVPGVKPCRIGLIQNATFTVFSNISLKELKITHCDIRRIASGAFDALTSLEVLDLSYNQELGLTHALLSLHGLQGNQMREISLVKLNGVFKGKEDELPSRYLKYLRNICVSVLDISQNYIWMRFGYPEKIAFRFDCLESFNMSYHTLIYVPPFLKLAYRLKYLDLSRPMGSKIKSTVNQLSESTKAPCLPSSLFSLYVTGYVSFFQLCHALPFSNSLRRILAANLNPFDCKTPFLSGAENLTYLDISSISCEAIYPEFFTGMKNITTLKLSNTPAMSTALESTDLPFTRLPHLQHLDLSKNKIIGLHPQTFQNNKEVLTVDLSQNRLHRLPGALWAIPRLQRLDLSSNSFTSLNLVEMKLLDEWRAQTGDRQPFRLLLRDNSFQCSCDTVLFMRWVILRKEFLDNEVKYPCLLSNGTRTSIQEFEEHLTNFEVQCVSHTYLIISVVGCLVFLLLILMFGGMYHYRLNLRYWLYTKLQPPENMFVNKHYVYDAFVAYTSDEYEWVLRQLRPKLELVDEPVKLCVHDRDFMPGKPIHENIVDKMKESRKIMLIISRGFLNSTYGPLEIEYAGMKSLEEGRDDIIVCVLMEEIPVRQMPRALRNLWHKITFVKWSTDPQEENIFWRNLKAAVSPGNA